MAIIFISQKSEETRGNATSHLQSHPIPKLYIFWTGWNRGWVMAFLFVSLFFLRGDRPSLNPFQVLFHCFLFHWEIQLPPSGYNNNSEKLTVRWSTSPDYFYLDYLHYTMKATWIMCKSDTETKCKSYGVVMNVAGPINTHPAKASTKPPISKYRGIFCKGIVQLYINTSLWKINENMCPSQHISPVYTYHLNCYKFSTSWARAEFSTVWHRLHSAIITRVWF